MEAILKSIKEGYLKAEPVALFSNNPSARGLEIGKKYSIPAINTKRVEDFSSFSSYEKYIVDFFRRHNVEWVICAGYMRILKEDFLRAYQGRILNIHPSLLPSFKGLKAQYQAYQYGVRVSGCTTHFIDEKVDHGPIILQAPVWIYPWEKEEEISRKILKVEHAIYWRSIALILEGFSIEGRRVYFKNEKLLRKILKELSDYVIF